MKSCPYVSDTKRGTVNEGKSTDVSHLVGHLQFLNAVFECSSMNCPLFSSPQHKPGSDRIKGQTLISSVR